MECRNVCACLHSDEVRISRRVALNSTGHLSLEEEGGPQRTDTQGGNAMGTEAETTVVQLQTRAPRTAGHRWKRGRAKGGFHLQSPGSVPADYLILVFWAPELQNNQLLLGHPACGCFFSSVQLSRSVVSHSLRPHGL